MRSRRRPALILAILAGLFVVLASPHGATAETDAERERDRVRRERGAAAANVDALRGDKAEVERALQELAEQLHREEEALGTAEREVDDAVADQRRAQKGIRETRSRLRRLEGELRDQIVDVYTNPAGDLSTVLDASSATDIVKRQAIIDGQSRKDTDLADRVHAAEIELRAQRRAAHAAERRAEAKRAEVQRRLDAVEKARDTQQVFADQVQERIDGELARAIELASRDRALSAQIVREQAQLQARLAYQRRLRQRAQQQQQQQSQSYGDDGSEQGPLAPPGGVTNAGTGTGGISVCNAAGITVNCQIAERVRSMIAAAAADGVHLSGSGYRDPAQQIALREAHCGSSYYAIYIMPSSQCSPPTARPGQSNHEVGLAIDFSNCSSRGSACFRWLASNASRFGFHNLPSEPWHWSIDGT